MYDAFLACEKLANGSLTRGKLRWNYVAMFPGVYTSRGAVLNLRTRIAGAWLWSGRDAVIAGRAAAFLHGDMWVDASAPIELIAAKTRSPAGIVARNERIEDSEIVIVNGMRVTNPARTAFDLARHYERDVAVRHLDAVSCATGVRADDAFALLARYPRARNLRRVGTALNLMDGGAQSPKETWLRLLLIDAGFPRPNTQVRVTDDFSEAFLDMGWEEPRIGADYDGARHQTDRRRFVHDIGRNELIARQGWLNLHVVNEHSRAFIIHRFADAFEARGFPVKLRQRS